MEVLIPKSLKWKSDNSSNLHGTWGPFYGIWYIHFADFQTRLFHIQVAWTTDLTVSSFTSTDKTTPMKMAQTKITDKCWNTTQIISGRLDAVNNKWQNVFVIWMNWPFKSTNAQHRRTHDSRGDANGRGVVALGWIQIHTPPSLLPFIV